MRASTVSQAEKDLTVENWLPTLITTTPAEGFELAIRLSRMAIKYSRPDAQVHDRLRPGYAEDAEALIAVSQVVATNFATIAAANDHWRGSR